MSSSLLTSPDQIAVLRRQLFELKEEVVLTLEDWQAIWPFIDNMWVERNASRAKDRQQFNCRVWRNDADKKSGAGRRNRVRRDVEPCSMKMYVIQKDNGVIISRCPGRTNDVREHNHDLGYLDKVKTPTAVMRIAADIMAAGKTPSEAVKELKMLPVVQALERDGGLYVDSNRVRNAHKASQAPQTNGTSAAAQKRNFLAAGLMAMQAGEAGEDTTMMEEDRGPPLQVSCQCGNARFVTPYAKPLALYHCHCLECQKQSASAYGTSAKYPTDAFFPLPESLQEQLSIYTRPTKSGGTTDCYFCKTCGARMIHYGKADDGTVKDTVSIKGGCIEGLDWTGGIHIWTKRAVVPIPKQAQQWRESPEPEPEPQQPPPLPVSSMPMSMPQLDNLAAIATAAASGGAMMHVENHVRNLNGDANGAPIAQMQTAAVEVDPTINPDLPAFPFEHVS